MIWTYVIFIVSAIVSFAMGWHWGYGHGRQAGIIVGKHKAKKAAAEAR